jgi:hypothetical protein
MRKRWRTLRIAVFVASTLFAVARAEAKILAQWVELGPDGNSSVRAISDDVCPAVTFDGVAVPMSVRSDPAQKLDNVKPAQFPMRGCEVAVPAGSVTALPEDNPLPLPKANPRRIVMFGDTGCRLKTGDSWQACNDPSAWPFPKVAALAAAAHPDLMIHIGGYEYRESPCPAAIPAVPAVPFENTETVP